MAECESEVRVGDIGTSIQIQILKRSDKLPYDVTGSSVLNFIFQKPTLETIERPATILDGPNGWVEYITAEGDFDQAGMWFYQIYIEKAGIKHHTDYTKIRIHPNLPLET